MVDCPTCHGTAKVPTAWPAWFNGDNAPACHRKSVTAGRHPFGMALINNGETCGSCRNAYDNGGGYWKCRHGRYLQGPATDLRKRWAACTLWEPTEA